MSETKPRVDGVFFYNSTLDSSYVFSIEDALQRDSRLSNLSISIHPAHTETLDYKKYIEGLNPHFALIAEPKDKRDERLNSYYSWLITYCAEKKIDVIDIVLMESDLNAENEGAIVLDRGQEVSSELVDSIVNLVTTGRSKH